MPRPQSNHLDAPVTVRLTAPELHALRALAADGNTSVSALVREGVRRLLAPGAPHAATAH